MFSRSLMATALLSSAMFTNGVFAAEWDNEAGISVSSISSDNFCLSDTNKQHHITSTITPDLNMQAKSARANLVLQAAAEFNNLDTLDASRLDCRGAGTQNFQSVIPSVLFDADLEVIDDWLTLESDAFVGRNRINSFAPGGGVDGRNNINITYQYGVGAVLQRRVLKSAALRLRYRYSEQYNDVGLFGDSRQDQVEFNLGTDRDGARFSTGVSGRYRKVYYDDSRRNPAFNNTLSSAELWAALQLTRSWEINALAGEEWNQFTSTREDIDGAYWDAGLTWTPNERVEIGVGTGERFFGTTSRFNMRYRHKRSELSADYARTLIFPSDLRAGLGGFSPPLDPESENTLDDGFDSGFDQLPGEPPVVEGNPTFIDDSPIIDERFTLRYRLTGRRSTLTVSASESHQLRTEDDGEATFSHINATFSRDLSARLVADIRLDWSEREGQVAIVGLFGEHSETWRIGPGISRRLGTETTVAARYQYTYQRSDLSQNEYGENRITLSLEHIF